MAKNVSLDLVYLPAQKPYLILIVHREIVVLSNYILISKSTKDYKVVQCLMRLTTVRENNMQQITKKCCVLLGKKFGSFDRGVSFEWSFICTVVIVGLASFLFEILNVLIP